MVSKQSRSRDTGAVKDVKTVKDIMPFGYTHIDITAKDAYECAKKISELRVTSTIAPDCLKDIHRKIRLLCLSGTVPVKIENSTYNIPISIYMKNDHPYFPPYCLVSPTNDMAIQPSRFVDPQGLLHLPYLHEWKPSKSNLTDLVQELITAFQTQCPLYSLSAALKVHMEIFDRDLSVKNITFMTVRSNTVQGLKVLILDEVQDKASIPLEYQTLIYRGIVLEDNNKISDYNVQNEVTLQLVISDVIPPDLCPLIPLIAKQEDRLKQQLMAELQVQATIGQHIDANDTLHGSELQDEATVGSHSDAAKTSQDSVAGEQYVVLQKRLADVEKQSMTLQQQLDVERQTSEMLKAKCQYLENSVIANLTERLEILENRARKAQQYYMSNFK